jgi:heptosyltransferase-2
VFYHNPNMSKAKRRASGVLVIQPLPGIGDMVWHIPHIQAIAHQEPEKKVSVLTKPSSLADHLLANMTEVVNVLWLHRRAGRHDGVLGFFRLVLELRQKRFRKVWLLHDSSYYAWATFLAGIPIRFGLGGKWQRFLLNASPVKLLPRKAHRVEKSDWLLNGLGVPVHRNFPLLTQSLEIAKQVHERYHDFQRPWFVFGIGCSEASRQWGAKNFCTLLKELTTHPGGTCFLLAGFAEQAMSEEISGCVEEGQAIALVQSPLQEVIALMTAADLFVGNDTGMLNISAAVGLITVGLLGHPISSWVATSSPFIYPVYPSEGMSENGIHQIKVSQVLEKIYVLQNKRYERH